MKDWPKNGPASSSNAYKTFLRVTGLRKSQSICSSIAQSALSMAIPTLGIPLPTSMTFLR